MLTDTGIFGGDTIGARDYPEPVFHIPLTTFAAFIASVPILGAAKGVLDIYRRLLSERTVKGTQSLLSDNVAAQVRLAKADLMVSAAEQVIRNVGRRAMEAGAMDRAEQVPLRIRLRAEMAFSVKLCRDAAALISEGSGSSVHRLDHPLQRMVRDINTMSSHVGFDVDASHELHGRLLLGMPPNSFVF
jgi:alkylation response protein AidB-like acyl-CoA dehydrogenase